MQRYSKYQVQMIWDILRKYTSLHHLFHKWKLTIKMTQFFFHTYLTWLDPQVTGLQTLQTNFLTLFSCFVPHISMPYFHTSRNTHSFTCFTCDNFANTLLHYHSLVYFTTNLHCTYTNLQANLHTHLYFTFVHVDVLTHSHYTHTITNFHNTSSCVIVKCHVKCM